MLVAHLSDLHVADVRDYTGAEAALHPKIRKHSERLLERLLRDVALRKPDHVVITGDLTLTAKETEFRRARAYLDAALPGVRLTVLPGNHDVWREEAVREGWFLRSFGDAVTCDLGGRPYPFCHLVGDHLALVGLDSSPFVPGAEPYDVPGLVGPGQLERLASLCGDDRVRSRFVVLLLHHHLRLSDVDRAAPDPKDPTPLADAAAVERALSSLPVGLVLHGHRHRQMRVDLAWPHRRVPVLCPGSATRLDADPGRTGRYGLYRLGRHGLEAAATRYLDPRFDRFLWATAEAAPRPSAP